MHNVYDRSIHWCIQDTQLITLLMMPWNCHSAASPITRQTMISGVNQVSAISSYRHLFSVTFCLKMLPELSPSTIHKFIYSECYVHITQLNWYCPTWWNLGCPQLDHRSIRKIIRRSIFLCIGTTEWAQRRRNLMDTLGIVHALYVSLL